MKNKRLLELLNGKSILITGATGLIGSNLVKYLLNQNGNIQILALVRSMKKAETVFEDLLGNDNLRIVLIEDGIENLQQIENKIDYIIHGANPTASNYFIHQPVETLHTAIYGTDKILKLAAEKQIRSMVFLSTMETYGEPMKGHRVTEKESGNFNTTIVRNCYPLSKQICENLCCSYYKEYGVPIKIARLTQTFGPGVEYDDRRVFAEFARCAIEKRNIILKTKGETERSYLYIEDAVTAILTILLEGESGQAYNVANEQTYCSIYEMAKAVAEMYGIDVIIQQQDVSSLGYANKLYMNLDTSKLKQLGWKPLIGLKEMYAKMIDDMERTQNNR